METNRLEQSLIDVGFSDKEAKVYLACLKLSGQPISHIAQEAGIKRPTVYLILDALQAKGYVNRVTIQGRERYSAVNPTAAVKSLAKKQAALEAALPDLLSLHRSFALQPNFHVYTGGEEIVELWTDISSTKGEVQGWCERSLEDDRLHTQRLEEQTQLRVKNKLYLRSIVAFRKELKPQLLELKKKDKANLRETVFVPEEDYPFHNELLIYQDSVAVIAYKHSVAISIRSEYLATTLRMIFDMTFKYAKQIEPQLFA